MPVQNSRTATRIVRFKLPTTTEEMVFAENAGVKVQLPVTSPLPALVVPKDAVIPVSDGHIVYLFKNGKAMRRNISLGQAVASGFIVRSGLQDGDIVVTRGNEQLSDGIHIEFVSEKAEASNKVNN